MQELIAQLVMQVAVVPNVMDLGNFQGTLWIVLLVEYLMLARIVRGVRELENAPIVKVGQIFQVGNG